jgi:hypothetical protein
LGLYADKKDLPLLDILTAKEMQLFCALKMRDYQNSLSLIQYFKNDLLVIHNYPPNYPIKGSMESLAYEHISFAFLYLHAVYLLFQNSKEVGSTKKAGIRLLYKMYYLISKNASALVEYPSVEYEDYDTLFGLFPTISNPNFRLYIIKSLLVKAHVTEYDYNSAKELLQSEEPQQSCIASIMLQAKLCMITNDREGAEKYLKLFEEAIKQYSNEETHFYTSLHSILKYAIMQELLLSLQPEVRRGHSHIEGSDIRFSCESSNSQQSDGAVPFHGARWEAGKEPGVRGADDHGRPHQVLQ